MTATSLNILRNGSDTDAGPDERMDQVRELLVGDHIRSSETRLASLEARVRDLETDTARRIDALSVRLEALAGEVAGEHRSAFDELARSLNDLGDRVRRISKP